MSDLPLAELRQALEPLPWVRLAALFGSTARGDASATSDLDIAVELMPEAPSTGAADLEVALGRALRRRVDVVVLGAAPPLLAFEVARDGRLVIERTLSAWVEFRARAMLAWWDWSPTAGIFYRKARERLLHG